MNNAKRKKSFYLKVSKLYLLISLLFFILNITYVFATTNKETQTYTSSSRAYKPHNEGEEKQVDWENPNTWDKVYDSNNKQILQRYFKEGSDEDNKQVNWDHDKTWDKTYYDGNFAEEVQAEEYILTERHQHITTFFVISVVLIMSIFFVWFLIKNTKNKRGPQK
ncbi:hypothetical protein MBSPM3_v1c1910 [Maize bushy stunt phytoplasma]|uniref:Uncharacterized protein n=1 Tax=Maize bushy stunt phytoplasma TaxID=202462 RepID=A0ABM6DLP6_9MOLU|nr:hypothetical protein [Maize bushy stunt phytoplasma]AOF54717.1 hypothetical protein MBSPM3_v1c1910 [Maize bushy stunt phytoplasma]